MCNPLQLEAQAAQTHVAREGCNVIYTTYVTRAGVALQTTVEKKETLYGKYITEICERQITLNLTFSNFKCKLVARVTISTYATGARAEMTR